MKNWAMDWTDKRLKELEEKIAEAYKTAEKEITAKMQAYLDRFAKQDAVMLAKYKNGDITKAELTEWRTNHFMMGKNWQAVKDSIAGDILKTDAISAGIVNNALIDVYTQNANYAYYELEQGTGTGLSFNLYDRNAVENLLKDNPDFMPHYEPKTPIVERWNKQHITSEMLQGILQGESIPHIAKRMQNVVGMEKNSAIRNARTYTTSVENKAKMDRYEEAEEMGIDLEKEWMATLDERTRESHRELDGERVANDEPFSNGLMYPADPSGDPAEVYNCRCRIVPRIKGRQYDRSGRANKLGDMSYEEWKRGKEKEEKQTVEENTIKEVTNKAEALESLKVTFTDVDEEVMKLNEELLVDNVNQFNKLNSRFGVVKANDGSYFSTNNTKRVAQASGGYRDGQYEISLSNKYYKKIDVYHEQYDRGQQSGWKMPSSDDYRNTYTITHEYGHILEGYVSRNRTDFDAIKADIESTWGHNPKVIPRYLNDAYSKSEKKLAKDIRNEIVDIAKSNNKNFDLESNLSKYGHTNDYEFFAEVFANSQCGTPNELGKAMEQWLVKEGF
jgi:SPP1 gp7 family putative phage head morphogenesis protein